LAVGGGGMGKLQAMTFGVDFCSFRTTHAWNCGMLCEDKSGICSRHKGKKESMERKRLGDYSGDSSFREKHGYFQAKEGR